MMGDTRIRHAGTIWSHSGPCNEHCQFPRRDVMYEPSIKADALELAVRVRGLTGSTALVDAMNLIDAFAARRVAEAQAWQPIETAPKDAKKPLLLFWPWWSARAIIGWWSGTDWDSGHTLSHGHSQEGPTHWRALPAPPTPKGEGW